MIDRPRVLSSSLSLFPVRTPTLLPATHTNSYAIGAREVVLVEPSTPFEDERLAWVAWARALASQGRVIVGMVATHHHPDHVGGAAFLAQELGLPLWAHRLTAVRMDARVDRNLEDGEVITLDGPRPEAWEVLHTPGHAPGHICLFDRESRALVVGDMVASMGTILIAPGDGDMSLYLAQLERLQELSASVALPAHGEPIETPSLVFERYLAHRLARETKIFDALAGAARDLTTDELVTRAYDDVSQAIWPIAKLSVEAHLEKLERDGRIARSDRPDAFRVVGSG